jgi:hypothetical protein
MRKKSPSAFALFLLFSFLTMHHALCPMLYAASDSDIDSSDRLDLLRQATGQQPTSNPASFQSRLDAILQPSAEPERFHVAQEDAEVRQQIQQEELLEEEPIEETTTREKKMDIPADRTRMDNTEKSYLKERDEIQTEEEERRTLLKAEAAAVQPVAKPGAISSLRPSLANNPFYFAPDAPAGSVVRDFNETKPIIISRLLQHGYTERNAAALIGETSSEEEVILALMKKEGMTFGQASEIVETS